jgi:hypothetical protein
MNQIDRRRESAEKRAVRIRNYQRARGRALARLAQEYPDQYRELLEQERAKDEANGKSWLDLSGRTKRSMGGTSTPDRQGGIPLAHTDSNEAQARHLGAEA